MTLTPLDLGQRVRDAIQASGKTQQAVGDEAGIEATALSKALAGKRGFSSLEIARLCEVLRASPMDLLADDRPTVGERVVMDAVTRMRHLLELDKLLTEVGLPPHSDRWPFTLFDRAMEAYINGHVSIRPIAGLLGMDADDLLDQLGR